MWTEFARRVGDQSAAEMLRSGWRYENGFMILALYQAGRALNSEKMLATVQHWLDASIGADGTIAGYRADDYNLDHINPGKVLLSAVPREARESSKYGRAIEELMKQMRDQPRTPSGGFWHKQIYPHQMWLDGIYMASPFLVGYGLEYHAPEWVDEAIRQIVLIDRHTYDAAGRLWYHGWDESRHEAWANPETGCSTQFWGRGVGWFAMALVDILEWLPPSHSGRRALVDIMTRVGEGLASAQDPESGLWWQVLDRPHWPGNYWEASASAMAVYALAKGVRLGVLGARFEECAQLGWIGLGERLVRKDASGTWHLIHCNAVSGLGGHPYRDGSYRYYVNSPVVEDDIKGVAAFILAGIEMAGQRRNPANGRG